MAIANRKKKVNFFTRASNIKSEQIHAILSILEGLDSPRSLSLFIALSNGLSIPDELLTIDPESYRTAREYQIDIQAIALLKKSVILDYQGDLKSEAELHFIKVDSEIPKNPDDLLILKDAGFIYDCRRIISSILGEVPSIRDLQVSFTSGSNARFKSEESTVADKLSRCIDVSPNASFYLAELCRANACLNKVAMTHGINIVKSEDKKISSFQVVPKQYNKSRGIVKTFFGDMLCQRAFGLYMRQRLRKIGIDLSTAQDVHKDVLRLFSDSFATIDLSDASDRISTELCRQLLPLDWFLTLSRIKSDWVEVSGRRYKLNKFMNQGNGFTFELETLLFYAIAMTAMRRAGQKPVCFVYGDDTIVPVASGITVMRAFELCGLVVNKNKSFINSPFKESCGFDTFNGIPCRPYYIKDLQNEKVFAYIRLANTITRIARNLFGDLSFCIPMLRAHNRLTSLFKQKWRLYVPEAAGDCGFIHHKPDPFIDRERQIFYFKYFKKSWKRDCYVLPIKEEGSELAYILSDHSSKGDLIRFSRYDVTTGRLYGFY